MRATATAFRSQVYFSATRKLLLSTWTRFGDDKIVSWRLHHVHVIHVKQFITQLFEETSLSFWRQWPYHQHVRFHEFTQWKAKENRIKNEFSFYRKIRHVSIHPNNGGERDLFSLLMTTTSSQHRWWGLATFLYNLLPCLHLDPEFWGPFTGSILLLLMNHFQVKALTLLRYGPGRTSHNVTRGCHIRSQCHTQRVSSLSH